LQYYIAIGIEIANSPENRSTAAVIFIRDISHKYLESLSELSPFTGASECAIVERRHRVKLGALLPFVCVHGDKPGGRSKTENGRDVVTRPGEETIRIVDLAELPSANNGIACPPGIIASIVMRPRDL